jgi:hypothetical protein
MKTTNDREPKTFIVEVEKALDWENGFLNWDNKVVPNIKDAQTFDSEEDANDAAALFNNEYGRNGRIYARAF